MPATVNLSKFLRSVSQINRRFNERTAGPTKMASTLAADWLEDAESRVPFLDGDLKRSRRIENDDPNGVIFGFNSRYAAFQDSLDGSNQMVIRPKRKKLLYVPLTPRGRKGHLY